LSRVAVCHAKRLVGSPQDFGRASLDSVTELVRKAVNASCDLKKLVAGKKVLIKPNLVRPIPNKLSTITDPRVIRAVALLAIERIPPGTYDPPLTRAMEG
jgi:uncharacterized protein (DUF362 family)